MQAFDTCTLEGNALQSFETFYPRSSSTQSYCTLLNSPYKLGTQLIKCIGMHAVLLCMCACVYGYGGGHVVFHHVFVKIIYKLYYNLCIVISV